MLKGSIVALITPFDGENLSEDTYIKLINYHLESGTNGIVPGGTTGESPTLSHNEHKKIIEIDQLTEGAACTTLLAEKFIDHNNPIDQYKEIGMDKTVSAAARAFASDLYAILEKGVKGPSSDGPVGKGPASAAEMEDYESDYRDPPSKPLKMGKGRRAPSKAELDMMKDYDI